MTTFERMGSSTVITREEYQQQLTSYDLFSERKKATGTRDHKGINDSEKLNKNGITKAKLSEWLGTVVCLIDTAPYQATARVCFAT